MNKYLLLSVALLGVSPTLFAQEENKNNAPKDEKVATANSELDSVGKPSYNKWSIEADFGDSKGLKPYLDKYYYGSNPDKFFGGFQVNHFGLAGRWMFSPIFGIKSHFSFDDIRNLPGSESKPFQMYCYQGTFEGVVNGARLFKIQDNLEWFGMLFHFGIQTSYMAPQSVNKGHHEWNGGFVVGLTPQFHIYKNFNLFVDFKLDSNLRQHFNWDGSYSDRSNNLTGSMLTTAFGISYSIGRNKVHGDFAIIESDQSKEIQELNSRIGEIESMLSDSDKDGVPDYLDEENNSLTGVAVDTHGRMVDMNGNGVPDQLEKYVDKSTTEAANNAVNNSSNTKAISDNVLEKLINEGYIAAYFDTGKAEPTVASADNIGFILNYLKNNPKKSIEIIGYADETGTVEKNNKLTKDRAENVKTILAKAGIDSSRMTIIGNGIDKSVDKKSEYSKRLVRKVIFKIK